MSSSPPTQSSSKVQETIVFLIKKKKITSSGSFLLLMGISIINSKVIEREFWENRNRMKILAKHWIRSKKEEQLFIGWVSIAWKKEQKRKKYSQTSSMYWWFNESWSIRILKGQCRQDSCGRIKIDQIS